ncbi:hypothetical protein ACFWSJ_39915, partial [Streptomyces niveus]
GSVVAAMAGAFSLQALFTLLNLQGVSGALESTVQGVIVIAAVGLGAADWSRLRGRRTPSGSGPPGGSPTGAAPPGLTPPRPAPPTGTHPSGGTPS